MLCCSLFHLIYWSSPPSLLLLFFGSFCAPPTPPTKSDTLIFAACPSPPLISSSFLAPSISRLHQVPERQLDLSHLGSEQTALTAGRKCSVSQSGRPSAAAVAGATEGQSCWQRSEEKKQITSFTIPTWGGEIKHLSAWWGFDQWYRSLIINAARPAQLQ